VSLNSFRIESFARGTLVDRLVLVSYLRRDGEVHQYSVDAAARNYLLFYDELLEWIIDRINNQMCEDKWEEVFPQLVKSDYPTSMFIALGAGEYTEWGAANFLQPKDECLVVVYDEVLHPKGPCDEVVASLFRDDEAPDGIVYVHQTFI